jgi:hypothetical protein
LFALNTTSTCTELGTDRLTIFFFLRKCKSFSRKDICKFLE